MRSLPFVDPSTLDRLVSIASLVTSLMVAPATASAVQPPRTDTAVFFAADGLRQDLVRRTPRGRDADDGSFLQNGAKATGNGLLTQAPPNTGAGWYTLATGAWPGVHGSTNNTFHMTGQAFGSTRTAAFDPGVLQAETIAQSAERGGLKVAQVEWAGGRNALHRRARRSTSGRSSRAAASPRTSSGTAGDVLFDDVPFITAFGLQFDHPAGFAGQAPFPGAAPTAATGWTNVPASYSPAKEMRLRVLDFGDDKYGLNAYIYDSTDNGTVDYDRVLFSPTKDGDDAVADLAKGEWADVKVKIIGGALDGKTAGMLVKVEELSADLSRVRLFHTSVSRAIAIWPAWPGEDGLHRVRRVPRPEVPDLDGRGLRHPRGRRHQRGDLRRAGPVLGDRPPADAASTSSRRTSPTSSSPAIPRPTSSSTSSWAWSAAACRAAPPTRPTTTSSSTANGTGGSRSGRLHPPGLRRRRPRPDPGPHAHGQRPDHVRRLGPWVRAAVPGDRREQGARRPGAALDAPDIELPAGHRRDDRQGQGLLGRRRRPDLPQRGRPRPGRRRLQQVADAAVPALVDADQGGLPRPSPTPTTGPTTASPKAGRSSTGPSPKAEARYIPNGPGTTADMAHPTRTGDVVAFAYPPYQFDAETPGTLVAPSHFFGQHGYVPDVSRTSARTSTCGPRSWPAARASRTGTVNARSIDLAPTLAYMLGVPRAAAQPGSRCCSRWSRAATPSGPVSIVGLNDFHGQLDPTTMSHATA